METKQDMGITTQDVIRSYRIEIRPPRGYDSIERFDHENKVVIVEFFEISEQKRVCR